MRKNQPNQLPYGSRSNGKRWWWWWSKTCRSCGCNQKNSKMCKRGKLISRGEVVRYRRRRCFCLVVLTHCGHRRLLSITILCQFKSQWVSERGGLEQGSSRWKWFSLYENMKRTGWHWREIGSTFCCCCCCRTIHFATHNIDLICSFFEPETTTVIDSCHCHSLSLFFTVYFFWCVIPDEVIHFASIFVCLPVCCHWEISVTDGISSNQSGHWCF